MRAGTQLRVLVACIGNPDRGDDGAGKLVAERLRGRLPAGVALVVRSGDMLGLIEDWAGCDLAICVDAAASSGAPGRIVRIDATDAGLPADLSSMSSHAFGLPDAVSLARTLGQLPASIVVYAIEGASFETGAAVTPAVAAAAAATADRICEEIARLPTVVGEAMTDA